MIDQVAAHNLAVAALRIKEAAEIMTKGLIAAAQIQATSKGTSPPFAGEQAELRTQQMLSILGIGTSNCTNDDCCNTKEF